MQLNGGALAGVRVAGVEALAATHAATTVIGDDEAGPTAYALGWETHDYLGRRVVQHGGDFSDGVSTMISMVPADGVGIVVLTNAFPEGHALATALTNTLYDLYIEGEPQEDWLTEQQRLLAGGLEGIDPRPLPAPARTASRRRGAAAPEGGLRGRLRQRLLRARDCETRAGRRAERAARSRRRRCATCRGTATPGVSRRPDTAAVFSVRDGRARSVRLMVLDFAGRDGLFVRR